MLEANAFYDPERNVIGAFMLTTLGTPAGGVTELGSVGCLLAHELSHAVFGKQTDVESLSIENLKCITKHREEVCFEQLCHMGNTTLVEDAADIMALAAVLDLLQQEKGELGGNPSSFTMEQYFFYTLTATFCTHELDHAYNALGQLDNHSPQKGRMNGLLMHSETFQKEFQCKPGKKMWREPSHFCHLLGPDAARR